MYSSILSLHLLIRYWTLLLDKAADDLSLSHVGRLSLDVRTDLTIYFILKYLFFTFTGFHNLNYYSNYRFLILSFLLYKLVLIPEFTRLLSRVTCCTTVYFDSMLRCDYARFPWTWVYIEEEYLVENTETQFEVLINIYTYKTWNPGKPKSSRLS